MGIEGMRPTPIATIVDRRFALAIGICTLATLAMVATGVHGHATMATLDLVLDTISAASATALLALAWARYRESVHTAAVYHAGAFGALAVAYGIAVIESLAHSDSMGSLARPEDLQQLVFAVAQLGAALLFAAGGWFTFRRSYGTLPVLIIMVPGLAVVAAALAGAVVESPAALALLRLDPAKHMYEATPLGAAVHLATAVLFFAGAYASRRLWRTGGSVIDRWLATGLVLAGFGELHWVLYPSAHPGQVSTGDIFRLACWVLLTVGLEASVRATLKDLRAANVELAGLRDMEVERAALEERARLARELHDGLAQDLWLAKLRLGEAAAAGELPDAARTSLAEAAAAIDVGLGEAREAVSALRGRGEAGGGFATLLARSVEEYGDRFGLRVEFSAEDGDGAHLDTRVQAEVLRIAQEAMTNAARHADASVVGVRLVLRDGRVRLRVVDNGRGFDPRSVSGTSFGLESMRQRAALIDGRLRVVSRPGDGTRVVLSAPLGGRAGPVKPAGRGDSRDGGLDGLGSAVPA